MRHSILVRFVLLISVAALIWSCKKEPDLLGLDLIPESDLLSHSFIDTVTVEAITVREDSLRTDELVTNLLGSFVDPIFGKTNASIYTQIRIPSNEIDFDTMPVADSIILTLPYKGYYGEKNAIHHVRVYELDDTLNVDNKYYHFSTVPVKSQLIGEATFIANTIDSVFIDTVKAPPLMRIPLSLEFATRLLAADSATLSTSLNFVKVFKGLYITVDDHTLPSSGGFMYLDLTSTFSRIHLYYRSTNDVIHDTTKFEFLINTNCARFNHYEHFDYAGASQDLLSQFAGNTESAKDRLFLQAMGGAKIKVTFPYLNNMASQKMVIHEASLVFESEDPDPKYAVPGLIGIRSLTEDGEYTVTKDEDIEGSAYLDGNASDDNKYQLRITRYIQNRLLHPDDPDYGLMLLVAGSSLSGNRAVIKGTGAGEGRMRLLLYYTPLD